VETYCSVCVCVAKLREGGYLYGSKVSSTWLVGGGKTDLVKSVPHCRLLESIAAKPRLICRQSGAGRPPSGPTWMGLRPM
jgi:hypothetical protein